MSQLGGTAFEDKYNNASTGKFKTGQSRGIGSDDYRDFTTDIKDSFVNKTDGAYATIKGLNPGINTIAGLKAITTTGLAVGPYVSFRDTDNADAYRCYQLVAGTDTESSPEIIRPTDYAASTNEKVWKLAVGGDVVDPAITARVLPNTDVDGIISFTEKTIYNTPTTPTSDNITNDLTDAKNDLIQKIYHLSSGTPSFPSGWVKTLGTYVPTVLNIIKAEWVSGTRVEYQIFQEQLLIVMAFSSVTPSSTEISVGYTVNQVGDSYFVAVPYGDPEPSALQKTLGLRYNDEPAPSSGFKLNADTGTVVLSGLAPSGNYQVYGVTIIEDQYSNSPTQNVSTTTDSGFDIISANARAGWEFGGIVGGEDDAITSRTDISGNGYDLTDNTGGLTPKIGYLQKDFGNLVSCLKCKTLSGVTDAMITSTTVSNLFKNSFEVHALIAFEDGQVGTSYILGAADGGTRYFDVAVLSTGRIRIRYAANASGLSTWDSDTTYVVPNGFTGPIYFVIQMNFANAVPLVSIDGIDCPCSLVSGNTMASWTPANWHSTKALGIGGTWSGAFSADVNIKIINRLYIIDTITASERLLVADYMTQF